MALGFTAEQDANELLGGGRVLIPAWSRKRDTPAPSRDRAREGYAPTGAWEEAQVNDVLVVEIPRSRSERAREILKRIAWRGYIPPKAGEDAEVAWHLPAEQIDLIRSVLHRNRRLAGASPMIWSAIDRVCESIAAESERTGTRPTYGFD